MVGCFACRLEETGKYTHIVGNLQVVFDSLFNPFKDKSATYPTLEILYKVLGGLIPDIVQDDNILADDDAEWSDNDVVDKNVEDMQQV
jgi:hypothetical protein